MDTNRIVIYNHDLSTATVELPVTRSGFTVVNAEKGPIHPVLIPAGGEDKLQDIFGLASKDYPQLYEVQSFISGNGFATYVSAPYGAGTKIPVAYVTKDGIFASEELVDYNSSIEKIVFNEYDEDDIKNIPGITSFGATGKTTVKVDTRYPNTNLGIGEDLPQNKEAIIYRQSGTTGDGLPMSTSYLKIYTGIEVNEEDSSYDRLPQDSAYDETVDYYRWDVLTHSYTQISKTVVSGKAEIEDYLIKIVKEGYFISTADGHSSAAGTEYSDEENYYTRSIAGNTYSQVAVEDRGNIYARYLKNSEAIYYKKEGGNPVNSLSSTFEDLINEGTILGLRIEGDGDPIIINMELKNVEVIDAEGTVSEDPNGVYIVWTRADSETAKVELSDDGYLCVPLTEDEANWFGETSNLKTVETYWERGLETSEIVGVIFPKYPSERTIHLSFNDYTVESGMDPMTPRGRNYLNFNVTEDGAFSRTTPWQIVGSLDNEATTAQGSSLAFSGSNSSYTDQEYVAVLSLGGFKSTKGFRKIKSYGSLTLKGGVRTAGSLEEGWRAAQAEEYSNVNVFFDSQRHDLTYNDASTSLFFSLAKAHPLSGFIFNITPADITNVKAFPQLSFGPNYWSICNEAILSLNGSTRIVSPMTGTRAKMQLRIIDERWGGIAPMYLNTGDMGGQLDMDARMSPRIRFTYTKDQQEALEKLNMNPVIYDNTYKFLVVGQKTCKSGELTDWSYIGHVSAFLEFEREVRETVMIPQLGKANNDYYRALRKQQVESILQKRLQGTTRIWAAASVDTSTAAGVNDAAARRARKFVINVRVKVDVFSEVVELNFTNIDQEMEV